jgi:hypothetical protein
MGGVVGAGGDDTEIARVEQFPTDQARFPSFALAYTIGAAQGA